MSKYKYIEEVNHELTQEQADEINKGGYGDDFEYKKDSPYYNMKAGDKVKWVYLNGFMELEVILLIQMTSHAKVRLEYKKVVINNENKDK